MPTPTRTPARPAPSRTAGRLGVVRGAAPRLGLVALVVAAFALLGAGPAAAHNTLRSSDPADGATVATAPDRLTLTFDQQALALGTEIVVTAQDGTTVSQGPVEIGDVTVSQPLAPQRPAGAYVVSWRVTSADGHPLTGSLRFVATEAVTGAAAPADPVAPVDPAAPAAPDASATTDAAAPLAETTAPADDMTTMAEQEMTATPISAPADPGTPPWVWVVLGVVVLALIGGGAALAARRRAVTSPVTALDAPTGTTPDASRPDDGAPRV